MTPVILRGAQVTLRPFRQDEFDRVWREETRDLGVHVAPIEDTPAARERLRQRLNASGSWTGEELRLAVEVDGRLIGDVQARRSEWALPPGVVELGIGLFADARGMGYGTEALALFTAFLFREDGVSRVQLSTDVDNVAMRRVAEHLGFGFEGILRGFMPSADGPRDHAIYGMTKGDFEDVRDAWTRAS